MHETVLLTFCDPLPKQCSRLLNLSKKEWRKLLDWLDISGLALYFLDRMRELQLCNMLPPGVLTRLKQNLRDNVERTRGMIAESVALQQEFQKACLSYATLKGFSLCPSSVPKPELRHQFDLDFLIAEKNVFEARGILERRGYRLYAISGRSWEFKINEKLVISEWIKRAGLQWLHRLIQDPRHLWRRYLRNNPAFLGHIACQVSGLRQYPRSWKR